MFKTYEVLMKKVEATRFTEEAKDRIFFGLTGNMAPDHEDGKPVLKVTTMHGETAIVRLGDWIVKDVAPGTYYPVKNEVFRAGYAAAEMVAGRQVAVAEPMPGAPGFTIAVFKAEDIPAGSVVWADSVTSDELLKG